MKKRNDFLHETKTPYTLAELGKKMLFLISIIFLLFLGIYAFFNEKVFELFSTTFFVEIPAQVNIVVAITALWFAYFKQKGNGAWILVAFVSFLMLVGYMVKMLTEHLTVTETLSLATIFIILAIGTYVPFWNSSIEIP